MRAPDRSGWRIHARPDWRSRQADRKGVEPAPWELDYRHATYREFLADLLARVRPQRLATGEHAGSQPLARLNVAAEKSWLNGLLAAWSTVADVFTFYQERIVNEGFLGTATEELSLREIVRLIDYVRFPGAGSSTHLAFSVLNVAEIPRRVMLPVGSAVASVPPEDELPQEWETIEEIEARADWNRLLPRRPHRVLPLELAGGATGVDLRLLPEGLEAGRPILILAGERSEQRFLRWLESVEPSAVEAPWQPAARLEWQEQLVPESPEAPLRPVHLASLEQESRLFGHDAPEWAELDDAQKEEIAAQLGGVLISGIEAAHGAGDWTSANLGLEPEEVTALAVGPEQRLFAGTPDGIFQRVADGSWAPSGRTLVGQRIECLAPSGRSGLVAGSAQSGVLRSADGEEWQSLVGEAARESILSGLFGPKPRSGRLPGAAVRALLPAGDRLFAGTDHGAFLFDFGRDSWVGRNRGLPGYARKTGRAGVVVRAISRGMRAGELLAGTDKGVFSSTDGGRRWRPRSKGLPGFSEETGEAEVNVFALLHGCHSRSGVDYSFAGTDQGVYRSTDGGASWQPASLGLPGTDYDTGTASCKVGQLAAAQDPLELTTVLFAGTPEGLYRSTDMGETWESFQDPLARRPISALGIDPDGRLAAAVPRGGFALTGWPGFHPRSGQIDLADAGVDVAAGEWLALVEETEDRRRVRVFRAAHVEQVLRTDFGLSDLVTRVVPAEPVADLESFDLRRTRVLHGARPLELFAGRVAVLEPLERERIGLRNPPAEGFEASRNVIVEGRRLRLSLAPGTSYRLLSERGEPVVLPDEHALLPLEPHRRRTVDGELVEEMRVHLPGGGRGELRAPAAAIRWRPAAEDDPRVAELATADWIAVPSGAVTLRLRRRLRNRLDPWTVEVHGNVAEATQGRTVTEDILGNGDSAVPFQRFPLTVPPLTHLRTATPKGWASTLEVRVNGIRWHETDSLAGAGPAERAFMVRPDLDGTAAVRFGDGEHGARLPTGHENVVATYRTGLWPKAVAAHEITLLRSKPLGLEGVTNPLPAAGGAPPESHDQTRQRAPISVRTLGRIVALDDYADLALTLPGIAQATVRPLSRPGERLVHLTVATDDGEGFADGSALHRQLLGAIEAARADPAPLEVEPCRRVRFEVHAELRLAADSRPGDVRRAARQALERRYSYRHGRFGERITASEVARLLEAVRGVEAVRLTRFQRRDRPAVVVAPYLSARPARWDPDAGRTRGAELLEVRPLVDVGITLAGEEA